jgi:hypothetical protein
MDPFADADTPDADDLNTLYAASLAFGSQWRRPVTELAATSFPKMSAADRAELVDRLTACRREVEAHVQDRYLAERRTWSRTTDRAARAWVVQRFPWVTRRNAKAAVHQAVYYAHHDNG